jgi:DNA-binding NarL/FixJ family response regulator
MKRQAITGLVSAIRQVLSGRNYVSEGMAQSVLERLGHDGATPDNPMADLSDRELEVFDLIGRGLSTAAIAEQIGVSIKTIETYSFLAARRDRHGPSQPSRAGEGGREE